MSHHHHSNKNTHHDKGTVNPSKNSQSDEKHNDTHSNDPFVYLYSQVIPKDGKKISSFQYKLNRKTKKSEESLNVMNLPTLNPLKNGQLYILALKNDGNYMTSTATGFIPDMATITVTRETLTGSVVLEKMTNNSGKLRHANSITNLIDSSFPIPNGAVVLRILQAGTASNSFETIASLLVEGYPETIKVNISKPEEKYSQSFAFQQLPTVPRRLAPTYPYYSVENGTVTEVHGDKKYVTKDFPDSARNTPSILICQVEQNFEIHVLTSFPFGGSETIILDCLNRKNEPRSLDSIKFENWNIKRTSKRLNTSYTKDEILPGMVFVKIVRKNVDDIIQIYDTLYPGPRYKDVKVRLTITKPTGALGLLNTVPIPDTKILPGFRKHSHSSNHKQPKKEEEKPKEKETPKKPEKKEPKKEEKKDEKKSPKKKQEKPSPAKPKPVVEEYYYYYSDEDEPPVQNVTIYVDEDGNIIEGEGAGVQKGKKISDVLKKMNESGAKVNVKEEDEIYFRI
ncbi:hypothetical protein TVAG_091350 [Trichomonas vaginalis G3]|uniref:Uncharacterized protein n=1 Tax=Trichomonas vaginalis (strain ATCC PRA-98 / G3) TaxID=412133 RepID=A2GB05_TRIV3|nr:hypothetical protein TVAGG3_0477190 [Trichomonas vaginalis G3]EAX85664.1 hypothetical protein TVAG_091350 [Trichomonas vaginalis G3]KAI5515489.1 hypothetical protein TVAGG3_0477190 [Trichomonas vaginalis G3]|eukprot:XP_001298594.1 hypothetical protein [Trichomonas vaginalis G3]